MEQLILNWNNMNGHIRAPLFDMILLKNWICDELHVLLRIYDRLWELIIAELKARGLYNDKSQKIIVDEMKRINVTFQFWENHETHNWNYTSLMGKDKLKVLQSFNFGVLFHPNPLQFKKNALSWLNLFLTPSQGISTNPNNAIDGLYLPNGN
ncbi:28992_t:CDS:2 [Gigaspora margarita]|uniref:28992_t:CDS:1 n=1 Tax=Gigaspora margarita TaxID=4874 RepID=A0ABN7V897_GIGMA|nr:28992_t:CDS:2 [Gigaspora margarita]